MEYRKQSALYAKQKAGKLKVRWMNFFGFEICKQINNIWKKINQIIVGNKDIITKHVHDIPCEFSLIYVGYFVTTWYI